MAYIGVLAALSAYLGRDERPALILGRAFLWAVLIPVLWPLWLILWGIGVGIVRFLLGPSQHASAHQILDKWEASWFRLDSSMRKKFLARPQVSELRAVPREAAMLAVERHRRLEDAVVEAQGIAASMTPTRRPILWWRWAIMAAVVSLVSVLVVGARDEGPATLQPGQVGGIEESTQPQWVTVKYRSTPVNVASGSFEYWTPETAGNVREAWWDRYNDYMLINLSGTVYHYCEFDILMWRDFTGSSMSADAYYDGLIKGYPWWDCREHRVPAYP